MYIPYQDHVKLIIHHPQTIFTHVYSPTSYFNIVIQSSSYQTSKNREATKRNAPSPNSSLKQKGLAQASSFRLGESSRRGE